MEQARKALKTRLNGLKVLVAAALLMMIIDRTPVGQLLAEDIRNLHLGFTSGFICAGVLMIIYLTKTLRDETKLKQWARAEQDERSIAIRAKAGMPILLVTSCLMLFAGLIIGYWHETVMKTLIIAAIIQMLFGLIAKRYYQKTM